MTIEQIIKTGDRAELKIWLASATNVEIIQNWIKLASCKIQDFQELALDELNKRKIIIK